MAPVTSKWGAEINMILALVYNVWAWLRTTFLPSWLQVMLGLDRRRSPPLGPNEHRCVEIRGPGGLDRLSTVPLAGRATVGYNVPPFKSPFTPVVTSEAFELPEDCVLLENEWFSVNFADVTIRWGLYESALRYVGWPIVPGFDVAGRVARAGPKSGFKPGDEVYGCTLFGAYSSLIVVPGRQLRKRPRNLSREAAAALPAVAGTALHAVHCAGFWPNPSLSMNKAVLIHSGAGGVGSMLIQICKLCGCGPIVAVVGSAHKTEACYKLGADVVIAKNALRPPATLWSEARRAAPGGFSAIFDANGVTTLGDSYANLCMCGRLVTYGFHSNLPLGIGMLSPLRWLRMAMDMAKLPRFDAMKLVLESKTVIGFNLSFFAHEHETIRVYLDTITQWVAEGKLVAPRTTTYDLAETGEAHKMIQSGRSIGKLVLKAYAREVGVDAATGGGTEEAEVEKVVEVGAKTTTTGTTTPATTATTTNKKKARKRRNNRK